MKVLAIDGKDVKLLDQVKVGEKRLAGISFTTDGKAAIVALRDENGAAVLSVDGTTVKLTKEKLSTGVNPYAVDVSSDGRWAVIGNTGVGGRIVDDADVVTLVDVSKRPFRAVQQISVPATPEGVAISPDGKWIVVSSMAGSNLTADDPGRKKLGKVGLYAIKNGQAVKVNELPGGEAAQGVVFSKDSKTVLVQFDVERAIAVYAVRDGKLVDTGQRISLAAGPVSIRSMPVELACESRRDRRSHGVAHRGLRCGRDTRGSAMMQMLVAFIAALIAFCLSDFVWLGFVAKNFYQAQIGPPPTRATEPEGRRDLLSALYRRHRAVLRRARAGARYLAACPHAGRAARADWLWDLRSFEPGHAQGVEREPGRRRRRLGDGRQRRRGDCGLFRRTRRLAPPTACTSRAVPAFAALPPENRVRCSGPTWKAPASSA